MSSVIQYIKVCSILNVELLDRGAPALLFSTLDFIEWFHRDVGLRLSCQDVNDLLHRECTLISTVRETQVLSWYYSKAERRRVPSKIVH